MLLRLFRGTLPAARLVDDPTLGDVQVDVADLNADVADRRARTSADPFMSAAHLDELMRDRHAEAGALSPNILHRLARGALVRSEVRTLSVGNVGRLATALFCHMDDVGGIVGRRRAGTLTPRQAAVIGLDIDVGPLLRDLRRAGSSHSASAAELAARGIVTVRGAAWTRAAVSKALAKPSSEPIPAIDTALR